MKSTTEKNKMGTEPIFGLLLKMSLPVIFSMLVQSLYNIVDSIFVAQIGEEALTAVSLSFPVQTMIIAVAVGTGVGLNSFISRKLGEQKQEEADSAAAHGVLLGIFSWLIFAVLGILFTRTFFEYFTDNETIINMGYDYIIIVATMSFGIFVHINVEKTLQATGNMIYPMLFQLVGAITNIVLDPILIFGMFGLPEMGISGAAIATVIGQILAMTCAVYVLFKKKHAVNINFKGFKLNFHTIKNIYAVGFPSMIMQSIASVMIVGLNSILITFSESAVSVLGVYYKLQSFVFMPVFGLTQGLMPILGFNYGAKNKDRLIQAQKIGTAIAILIMGAGTLMFMLIPEPLLMMFNASENMIEIGVVALRVISSCFVFAAINITLSTLFQALGKGQNSMYISILRQLVIILPVAYLLSKVGLTYVWFAFPVAEFVALIISLITYRKIYKDTINLL